jgi:hypothetical protein
MAAMLLAGPLGSTRKPALLNGACSTSHARSAAGNAPRAAAQCREALSALGRRHVSVGLRDDTAIKLTLAGMRAATCNWDQALRLFDRVVVSRLPLLGQRTRIVL